MKQKNLIIALTLAAPALFAIGCGVTETRTVVEEPVAPIETIDEITIDVNESNQPTEELMQPVYAEAEINDSETVIEAVVSEQPVMSEPEALTFYFSTGDSNVKQEDYDKLIAHADYLMQNPDKILRISGHTDQSGPVEYNQWLSEQRAKAVARILIEYGVPVAQIKTESLGASQPIAGLEHAIADRRVELEYAKETQLSEANSF